LEPTHSIFSKVKDSSYISNIISDHQYEDHLFTLGIEHMNNSNKIIE